MIKISKQVDYGLQFILALADKKKRLLSLKKFSEESNISFLFLQKIARSLREAGIITSTQGPRGGYALTRPPNEINLKEVIEAIEGSCGAVKCARAANACDIEESCTIKSGIMRINEKMVGFLEQVKVDSLVS